MESLENATSNFISNVINYRTKFRQTHFKKSNNGTFETKLEFKFLNFVGYNINKVNTKSLLHFNKYIDLYINALRNRTKISKKFRVSLEELQLKFYLLKITQVVSNNNDLTKAINTNATKQFQDWGDVALPTPAYNMTKPILKERVIDYTILTQLQTLTVQLKQTANYLKIRSTSFSNKKLIQ